VGEPEWEEDKKTSRLITLRFFVPRGYVLYLKGYMNKRKEGGRLMPKVTFDWESEYYDALNYYQNNY
jgi:hypothetical protein